MPPIEREQNAEFERRELREIREKKQGNIEILAKGEGRHNRDTERVVAEEKMDTACEVWRISIRKDASSDSIAGKPAAKTYQRLERKMLNGAPLSELKDEPSLLALSSAGGMRIPFSVCHFLHSTPTTFNDE